MKKAASLAALVSLALTSCGLKVPVTVVAGSEQQGIPVATSTDGTNPDPGNTSTDTPGVNPTGGPAVGPLPTTVPGTSLFPKETEGVTSSQITICGHVPITGAAPIPHAKARFGQFYFDYINKEKGGLFGRKIKLDVFDDGYNPPGARSAVEQCAREGSFFYYGAAGTDQIVSVAKWAEQRKVPYLHGPTSDKDLHGLTYSVGTGTPYEYQSRLLADYLVQTQGKDKKFGMIRVDSPYFKSGHDAFVDQLKKYGVTLAVDVQVEKDAKQFQQIYYQLVTAGVQVINNFTTPNIWIPMLQQKPQSYDPLWSAIGPIAGFNIVAAALANSRSRASVFQTFNPACHCTFYNTDLDTSVPWAADEQEFLRIFKKYSPEQKPPPDDFDYASYLAAKGLLRLLTKLGPQPTRSKLWKLLETYKETNAEAFPSCPADFTRVKDELMGQWRVNVFDLDGKTWKQTHTCIDHWPA